jgi:hypothetical protein
MRRVLALTAIAIMGIAYATTPASATSPPTIVTFPKGDFDLGHLNEGPAGVVCPFDVTAVSHAIGPGHAIIFDGQGVGFAAMGFGAIRLEIVNEDTGASATVNISGPGGLNGDGIPVLGRGPWVVFEPIDVGGIRFFHGLTEFVPAPYGVHGISTAGTEENLCDRVA